MADDRAGKLAAARRKLKAYQEKSAKLAPPSNPGIEIDTNDMTNAICKNDIIPTKQQSKEDLSEQLNDRSSSPLVKESSTLPLTSSSESLRQISMQLNGLVSQTHEFFNGDVMMDDSTTLVLEKRNQELASMLETQKQINEQLSHKQKDLEAQITKLQQQLKNEREEFDEKQYKEQGSLREQLQVHIQTIGILVAEKTELQSSLSQYQQTAKQKAGEVEEFQGRLKASRQRVSDLERELATTTLSSQQIEKSNKQNSKEVDRLKMDIYKVNKLNEELEQCNSELQEKLSGKLSECKSQAERIEDLQSRLAMTELRVKQLSSGSSEQSMNQLEELQQEKIDLERKVAQMKDGLRKMTEDRDQVTENYQKFTKQLNQQIHGLTEQVTSLNNEKESLQQHNSSLEAKISELKTKLEECNKAFDRQSVTEEGVAALELQLKDLERKESELQRLYQSQIADNSQLSHLLEEREMRIEELESQLSETHTAQVDTSKLLETIQSEKVAASRAMTQNKELKLQLEELQNGFVKMSNDKLNLTEKLLNEQHISKELGERLSQQEEELKELRDQLDDKERRLSLMQKSSTELTKQMYQQHQIADRLRHFEAQGQLTEMIQQELNQAQERINALTAQNSELRTLLANQAENLLKSSTEDGQYDDKDSFRKDEMVVSLSASVRQLEMERNQLMKQLEDQQQQREAFKAQLQELNEQHHDHNELTPVGETDGNDLSTVSLSEYQTLKQAMNKLEDRFMKTMNDIANLSEEKQQLEYLVMQLQGETETIGDYIALYQMQRSVMKQQVIKKDEYITSVCRDREQLKEKLAELQDLVYRLLFERQQLQGKGVDGHSLKLPGKAKLANGDDSTEKMMTTEWPNIIEEIKAIPGLETIKQPDDDNQSVEHPLENGQPVEIPSNPTKTARKIIDLISEIGSTSLMEKPVSDNFHPCPVCSGRLQTV